MKYEVLVAGAVLYQTSDELIAHAIASSYRNIGWKIVEVVTKKGGKR